MSEKVGQDFVLDVLSFHTIGGATLFDHLQYNLLHLFVWRLELSDEDQHHFSSIIVRVLSIHQRNEITDGFEEGRETFTAMGTDTFPERFQDAIETLDT